jgi:GrpB-like predicted nucleotidyltransferase (UPF0157 family)
MDSIMDKLQDVIMREFRISDLVALRRLIHQTDTAEKIMNIELWIEDQKHRDVIPYSDYYSEIFEKIKNHILNAIPGVLVEHFGSTSIPGIQAKPMIDVLVVVDSENLADVRDNLIKVGYQRRNVWVDTKEKPYVCGSVKWKNNIYNINVHICRSNSPDHKNNLKFRDILRQRGDLRNEYEKIKLRAIKEVGKDAKKYNDYKQNFILKVIAIKPSDIDRGRVAGSKMSEQ